MRDVENIDRKLLLDLGLTNNEIEVYLKLLMSGSVTVNTIAERTGLHRQACYDALDRLLEKGFVNFVIKDNKKHFQALEPEKVLAYIEEMKNRFSEMLPTLNKISQLPKESTVVEVFKGENTLRFLYRDVLATLKKTGGELLVSGVEESKFLEYDESVIERHIHNMKKFGFKEKLLTMQGTKFFFPGEQSEYRLLPKRFFNPNPMHIYADKVVFIIWGTPVYAVVIKNREIADANRKQFYLLWHMAKKHKN